MLPENDNLNTTAGATEADTAVETDIASEIERINAEVDRRDAAEDAEAEADEIENEDAEAETEDADETDKSDKSDAADAESFQFTENADAETFEKEAAAYLESVEIPPQLQTILDRRQAEIESLRSNGAGLPESIARVTEAFNQVYKTEVSPDGTIQANVAPVVDVLQKEYASEFSDIARGIVNADSKKYAGASVFVELLRDEFGATPEKIRAVSDYLSDNTPSLPQPAPVVPEGIDRNVAEAFQKLPEQKQFSLTDLSKELTRLREELKTAGDAYDRQIIAEEIQAKETELNAETESLRLMQRGITAERLQTEAAARQQQQAQIEFENKVNTDYNAEIFGIADGFAKEIANGAAFLDEAMRLPFANNMLARVQNALSFEIGADGSFMNSPTADYYAAQLKNEGVDFDFQKGRELLKRHYEASRKVALLEAKRVSPAAIETAKREKNTVLFELKAEQKQLLGKLSAKFTKSSNKAIEKQVQDLAAKKQKARVVIPRSAGVVKNSGGDVYKEIAAVNRKAAVANGDDLYNQYSS